MTDSGAARPNVPDPQHDRHVSFPDDVDEPLAPAPSLPPEAWAPRGGLRPRTLESQGQPTVPGFLTAPRRPMGRRRSGNRGAGWIVALVVAPLFLTMMHGGTIGSMSDGGYPVEQGAGPIWDGSDSGSHGGMAELTIEPVSDERNVAPLLAESTAVQGVPAGTTQVRIEVVGSAGDLVDFEVLGPDGAIEKTVSEPLPLARTATDRADEHMTMHINAQSARGTEFQCRVYAGTVLVALDTSRSSVTCSVTW